MSAQMNDHQEAVKNLMAERYLLGELDAGEREAYEEHLFSCDACFEQVKAGTEFVSHLRQIGAEEQVKAGTELVGHLRQIGAEDARPAPAPGFLARIIGNLRQPVTVRHWGFEQVKAGTEFVSHLRGMGMDEAAEQPNWKQTIYRAFRPSPALAFAIMFLCVAGISARQAVIIHKINAPESVTVVTVSPEARTLENPLIAPRQGNFELRTVFQPGPKLQSYRAKVVSSSGKEVASVAIKNPDSGELQMRVNADSFKDGDYVLIVQATDQATGSIEVIEKRPFKLMLQD